MGAPPSHGTIQAFLRHKGLTHQEIMKVQRTVQQRCSKYNQSRSPSKLAEPYRRTSPTTPEYNQSRSLSKLAEPYRRTSPTTYGMLKRGQCVRPQSRSPSKLAEPYRPKKLPPQAPGYEDSSVLDRLLS